MNDTQPPHRFAIPARLHVFVLFMTQFIFLLAAFGIVVPTLHERGVNLVLLIAGSIAAVLAVHLLLGALAKQVPVRCRSCQARAWFQGFGWWPFSYRYRCERCGTELQLEVRG